MWGAGFDFSRGARFDLSRGAGFDFSQGAEITSQGAHATSLRAREDLFFIQFEQHRQQHLDVKKPPSPQRLVGLKNLAIPGVCIFLFLVHLAIHSAGAGKLIMRILALPAFSVDLHCLRWVTGHHPVGGPGGLA